MSDIVIEFDRVSKHYLLHHHLTGGCREFLLHLLKHWRGIRERFTALQDISFTIRRGESVGIVGRNGAGKSTLLGLMAGVQAPDAGRIIVNGRVTPMLELGCGFHPDLTGSENALLNAVLLGLTLHEARCRLPAILEFAELGPFADEPIRIYSAGMLARLGFSIITQVEPRILLIDEVLAVGDVQFRAKCYDQIHRFQRSGTTLVFVSHSSEEVQRLCQRAIWIHDRTIRMMGATEEVITAYSKHFSSSP